MKGSKLGGPSTPGFGERTAGALHLILMNTIKRTSMPCHVLINPLGSNTEFFYFLLAVSKTPIAAPNPTLVSPTQRRPASGHTPHGTGVAPARRRPSTFSVPFSLSTRG